MKENQGMISNLNMERRKNMLYNCCLANMYEVGYYVYYEFFIKKIKCIGLKAFLD